jgi:hypothetical protein
MRGGKRRNDEGGGEGEEGEDMKDCEYMNARTEGKRRKRKRKNKRGGEKRKEEERGVECLG